MGISMTRRVDIQLMLILTACILIFGYTLNSTKKTAAITIGFAGDIMIGRLVNEVISQKGYSYPWGDVLPLLQRTDLNIINLETTLTTSTDRLPKTFNYKASPDRVKTLQEARIDIVNLANNHIRDFGDIGLLETIKTLDAAGIKHVGAGKNIDEAHKPVIITKNNVKIGIVGYTDNEPGWQAQENKSGTNYIKVGDIDKIHRYITPLHDKVDLLIVSIHWGPNMRERPTEEFINFAHAMIDAGVDIIHGHSAHIFQGIEIYKNKIIMYDTGDFVDDYMVDPILRNDWSFFYQVMVDKKGIKHVRLIPVIINNMQVNMAQGTEKSSIIKRMQKLSEVFGTRISDDGVIKI